MENGLVKQAENKKAIPNALPALETHKGNG
jgi:hypothetical protein